MIVYIYELYTRIRLLKSSSWCISDPCNFSKNATEWTLPMKSHDDQHKLGRELPPSMRIINFLLLTEQIHGEFLAITICRHFELIFAPKEDSFWFSTERGTISFSLLMAFNWLGLKNYTKQWKHILLSYNLSLKSLFTLPYSCPIFIIRCTKVYSVISEFRHFAGILTRDIKYHNFSTRSHIYSTNYRKTRNFNGSNTSGSSHGV